MGVKTQWRCADFDGAPHRTLHNTHTNTGGDAMSIPFSLSPHHAGATIESLSTGEYACAAAIRRAMTYYPARLAGIMSIPVEWNYGLKSAAGRYHGKPHARISLHPGLLREGVAQARETLLHELAHAMAHAVHGTVDHSIHWLEMMFLLGQRPVRTHDFANCSHKSDIVAQANAEELGL
jgi:hypothetical protein